MDIFLNLFRDEYESLEKNGVRNLDGSIYYYLDHVPWAVTFQSETLDGSSIKPLVEYITGKDLITGEKLTEYEKNAQLRRAGYNMGSLGVEAVIASSIPGVGWAAVAGAAALAEVNNITGAATYSVTKKIVQELGGSDNLAEKVGKGAEFVVSGLGGKLIYDKFLKPRAVANAVEVVVEGGSEAISQADRIKINNWKYTPSDELYLKYKDVYDNPMYYDQVTGEIHWPVDDGFKAGSKVDKIIKKDTIFKRYGDNSGEFLGNAMDSFESRALAPHSENAEVHYYQLMEDYEMTTGEATAWFGGDGGAEQFVKYKPDSKKVKYTVQELENAGILEDITDLVEEGVIRIE